MTPIESSSLGTGPIVIKLGGAVLTNPEALATLAQSLAEFNKQHPGKLVLIHGGGSIADAKLARAGLNPPKHHGLRATPPEAIDHIIDAFKGTANATLVAQLHSAGLHPVGLTLTDLNTLSVETKSIPGVDLGRVGTPAAGSSILLKSIMASGHTPVLCSLGLNGESQWLNVNADEAAGALACSLKASTLIFLSDVPAVLNANREPIESLDESSINQLIESGVIEGGMIPKVHAALHAAQAAGCPAIIASWNTPDPINAALAAGSTSTRVTSTPLEALS